MHYVCFFPISLISWCFLWSNFNRGCVLFPMVLWGSYFMLTVLLGVTGIMVYAVDSFLTSSPLPTARFTWWKPFIFSYSIMRCAFGCDVNHGLSLFASYFEIMRDTFGRVLPGLSQISQRTAIRMDSSTACCANTTRRGVNGLDIYSKVTVDHFWIFYSLPTICQLFVNSLEINVKTNTLFLKLMNFVNIVVAEYLLFGRYSEEIRPFGSIH